MVKAVDAKVALLEFILVEVRPPPDLGVDDVREPLSTRNLQIQEYHHMEHMLIAFSAQLNNILFR